MPTNPQPGLKLPDEVVVSAAKVIANRDPKLYTFTAIARDALTAALRLDDPETVRLAFQAATDDLLGRKDPTGEDWRTKELISNPETAKDAAERAVRAFWEHLTGAEPEEAGGD